MVKATTSIATPDPFRDHLKQIVTDAGGDWCGVQESIDPTIPYLLLFTSQETGSTLAVPFNPVDFDDTELYNKVLAKLTESNQKFADRPISVKASVLQDLSNRLMKLVNEIDALYLRSEKCPTPRPSKTS